MLQTHLRQVAARHLPRVGVPLHRHRIPGCTGLPQQEGHQQLLLATQLDRLRCHGTVWNTGDFSLYINIKNKG